MQRWWFLEDSNDQKVRDAYENAMDGHSSISKSSTGSYRVRNWTFRVRVADLAPGEVVCVTGSCDALGNWMYGRVVPLQNDENDDEYWFGTVDIPLKEDVTFRYCICVIEDMFAELVYVRKWETNLEPRLIKRMFEQGKDKEEHLFGFYNGKRKVDQGWLTTDTAIQIKCFDNPIQLKPKLLGRPVYVKITPVNLRFGVEGHTMLSALEESLSGDTHDVVEQPAHALKQVASMTDRDCRFHEQDQFGQTYHKDDVLVYNLIIPHPTAVAYLIDLYIYSSTAAPGEPPNHFGYHYILPGSLKGSEGQLEIPLTCAIKHRPIGQIKLEYLKVLPLQNYKCNMAVSYAKYWNPAWKGLDVGHRGNGTSFKNKDSTIRENTIASLRKAAEHGADMVEFDVQLSKDLVPIIYHDFHVCVSMKKKQDFQYSDMLELPVKELTLEQLHKLKVYHLVEGRSNEPRFFDEDLEEHQPFPLLSHALQTLQLDVGFNVEIKWSMRLKDGSMELYNPFDMNMYVDKILEVVLTHAGTRRIVFSCFHPDICTMIRLKQNIYPVMFLTQGVTDKYPRYHDDRCFSIPMAVRHAVMQDLLGIVVHTEDLLRDGSQLDLPVEFFPPYTYDDGDENADWSIRRVSKTQLSQGDEGSFNQFDGMLIPAKYRDVPIDDGYEGSIEGWDNQYQKFPQDQGDEGTVGTTTDIWPDEIPALHYRKVFIDEVKLALDADLVIFCWGDDNNNKETIQHLKSLGLHAVIYDKLDQYVSKDVKESIFLMQARELSKEILQIAELECYTHKPDEIESLLPKVLDLQEARELLDNVSTATSLASIATSKAHTQSSTKSVASSTKVILGDEVSEGEEEMSFAITLGSQVLIDDKRKSNGKEQHLDGEEHKGIEEHL